MVSRQWALSDIRLNLGQKIAKQVISAMNVPNGICPNAIGNPRPASGKPPCLPRALPHLGKNHIFTVPPLQALPKP
jgi:hypothetical protein